MMKRFMSATKAMINEAITTIALFVFFLSGCMMDSDDITIPAIAFLASLGLLAIQYLKEVRHG